MGVYTVNQTDGSLVRVAGGTLYADAPIGAIQSYGGETAPAGWLICDGSTVSRTEYAELFAVIGINFGEGDGETTFGIPDLRECVPVGAGKNITKSIATHDRYDLGQFKDDALGTHNHPLVSVTTATFNTAGVPVGIGNNNTPTSATHGKQLGVNYIIKAKMVGVPADFLAEVGEVYQKKDLAQTVEGATTVEGALGALSTNKASKVSSATADNLAALDASGNLIDSGRNKYTIPILYYNANTDRASEAARKTAIEYVVNNIIGVNLLAIDTIGRGNEIHFTIRYSGGYYYIYKLYIDSESASKIQEQNNTFDTLYRWNGTVSDNVFTATLQNTYNIGNDEITHTFTTFEKQWIFVKVGRIVSLFAPSDIQANKISQGDNIIGNLPQSFRPRERVIFFKQNMLPNGVYAHVSISSTGDVSVYSDQAITAKSNFCFNGTYIV